MTFLRAGGGGAFESSLLHIEDQKTAGTNGDGYGAANVWQTRTLNTVVTNEIGGASLASNVITLPSGTYYVEAEGALFRLNKCRNRLYNVTDAAQILLGVSDNSDGTADSSAWSPIIGRFTLAASKDIRLEGRGDSANGSHGFGINNNIDTEIYAVVRIWKIA